MHAIILKPNHMATIKDMRDDLVAGGLYSIESGDSGFAVAKVLALGSGMVHTRLYREKFESRPNSVDPAALSLGSVFESADVGIGHTPLALDMFLSWQPVLLMKTGVTDEELVGYRFWKDSTSSESPNSPHKVWTSVSKLIASILRRKRLD